METFASLHRKPIYFLSLTPKQRRVVSKERSVSSDVITSEATEGRSYLYMYVVYGINVRHSGAKLQGDSGGFS